VARRPRQRGRRRSVTQRRRPRRIYPYRGRVFCRDCKRRLAANPFPRTTYWRCHHDPANPRHQAAHPDHPRTVQVAETQLDEITRRFLAARVFGPGRAELLAAQLPATDAEAQARRDAQAAALAVRIRKLDTAQNAQITALEEIPDGPAAAAMRARIRTRFAELHQQRTQAETELDRLTAATPRAADPALLDELPYLGDILPDLPPALRARLFAAVDLTILWNKTGGQATVTATITDATLAALPEILDPTQDGYHDTAGTDHLGPLAQHPLAVSLA
jgi:site-specific DNA recombinase